MRKAFLVLGICILAVPAWAGGGYSLFGTWSEINEDASAPGAGMRVSIGGKHRVLEFVCRLADRIGSAI